MQRKDESSMAFRLARVALLALGIAACGYAQGLRADIPFAFQINGQSYESGRYYFSPDALPELPHEAWRIRSEETRKSKVFPTFTGTQTPGLPKASKLVFHRYGRTYFLAEVWLQYQHGWQLPESQGERQLANRSTLLAETVVVDLAR